jgi:YhcH/YjgK/YiaL family protein
MILSSLDDARRWEKLHPAFPEAFAFLRRNGLDLLPKGRHEIDGNRLYAVVIRDQGHGKDGTKLEVHRRYIDIQYSVTAADLIGWKQTADCHDPEQPFNEERDFQLFRDTPDSWTVVPPGCFAIFFPEDAHAPQAADGAVHKVVVKVAVDWAE